jgi:hypothetical protein
MTLFDDEIGELPRRLFAMARRTLERACATASAGEGRSLGAQRQRNLAGELHGCGQDLMVISQRGVWPPGVIIIDPGGDLFADYQKYDKNCTKRMPISPSIRPLRPE